jgi:hypothetical protein
MGLGGGGGGGRAASARRRAKGASPRQVGHLISLVL